MSVRVPNPSRRVQLLLEPLEARAMPARFIVVGSDAGVQSRVRLFTDTNADGIYETLAATFKPFGTATAGVRVAMGDFDGDGNDELVCGTGLGFGRVNIYDVNSDGTVGARLDTFLAFPGFTGGVNVAAGDLDGDGRDELAVSKGSLGCTVNIYSDTNSDGLLSDNRTDTFNPFGGFQGGTRIAFGDTNLTGGEELIVARGPGGAPTVKVYTDSDADRAVFDNTILESFNAFGATYKGGITVAAGPLEGVNDGGAEVMVARDTGSSVVRILSDADDDGLVGDDPLFDSVPIFTGFNGGLRLASGDTDSSGVFQELIVGAGPGGGTLVIRDDDGDTGNLLSDSPVDDTFPVFSAAYKGGMFVAFGQVTNGTFTSTTTPTALPDEVTVTSSIIVPTGAGTIQSLTVDLDITHTFNPDLTVSLTHVPSGTTILLFDDVGDGGESGFDITLQDGATGIGGVTGAADTDITGTFAPESLLSDFAGLDASGEWQLTIVDVAAGDEGTLNSWSLNFAF